jgi:hypothetical protein
MDGTNDRRRGRETLGRGLEDSGQLKARRGGVVRQNQLSLILDILLLVDGLWVLKTILEMP